MTQLDTLKVLYNSEVHMMKNGLEGMLEIVQEGMNKGPFNGNVTGGGYQIPIFAREKNVDPP